MKTLYTPQPREDLSTAFPGSELEQWIKLWFSENVSFLIQMSSSSLLILPLSLPPLLQVLYLVRVIQICQKQLPTLLHMVRCFVGLCEVDIQVPVSCILHVPHL